MTSLSRKLLNNPGLIALTVDGERKELFSLFHGGPYKVRPHKIVFAHFQKRSDGSKLPFWHVIDTTNKSYQSTLSMEGLRSKGVL